MNSDVGRDCWWGEDAAEQVSCRCSSDPPLFDVIFPGDATAEVSTIAPSTLTDGTGYYTVMTIRTSGGVSGEDGGGGGGGSNEEVTFSTMTAAPPDFKTPHTWMKQHPNSLKLMISAALSLACLVILLVIILICFLRKKRKRSPVGNYRPEVEGCEADGLPRDVKNAIVPSQTKANHQNAFPLVDMDDDSVTPQTRSNHTSPIRPTNAHNVSSPRTPAATAANGPAEKSAYPLMKSVRAKIVGSGISPSKKPIRPVSRQDSNAPLVAHEAAVYRDRWKPAGAPDPDSRLAVPGFERDSWRPQSDHFDPSLSPLDEAGDRTSKEVQTQLEILPSRLFPESRILESPSRKKPNWRPDSSTPLFDSDSVSSVET